MRLYNWPVIMSKSKVTVNQISWIKNTNDITIIPVSIKSKIIANETVSSPEASGFFFSFSGCALSFSISLI